VKSGAKIIIMFILRVIVVGASLYTPPSSRW